MTSTQSPAEVCMHLVAQPASIVTMQLTAYSAWGRKGGMSFRLLYLIPKPPQQALLHGEASFSLQQPT